jgi:uncharacterized damage-inducible protein DinB
MGKKADSDGRVISTQAMLDHWQGHRRLSRRVLEAFPEDQLFEFSIGGMRTFGDLAKEMLAMAAPMARGVATGEWGEYATGEAKSKQDLLRRWDESTKEIDEHWPQIPLERFHETVTAFGQFTDTAYNLLLYVIDNEVHHRGQAYVYLRALGVEPPAFWERG